MSDIIIHATSLINEILNSCSDARKSQLINTRDDLNRLLERDFLTNDWNRLYCRQLKRLMTYENLIKTDQFWIDIHNDILFVLNKSNNEHNTGSNWQSFIKRMELESKMEQREMKFKEKFGERKGLNDLLLKNETFMFLYRTNCILFHSKVQIRDLIENIDDLFQNIYRLRDINLSSENRKHIEEKLKCIEIPFINQNISMELLFPVSTNYNNSHGTLNNTLETFQPSTNQLECKNSNTGSIHLLLMQERWLVVLGEPGSAKTSLLQSLVLSYTHEVMNHIFDLHWKNNTNNIVRIPIFIRLVEFASWFDQHQTQTLIDYIGEHTYFSKRYCSDDTENVLKQLIYHGYTLILFDGLDEIDVERRGKIVELVKNFIDEYAQSSEFISVYDEEDIQMGRPYKWSGSIFDIKTPTRHAGNQVIVTSRILGYQIHPLDSVSMMRYSISLMTNDQAKLFTSQLISEIERSLLNIVQHELVQIMKYSINISFINRTKTIDSIFENYPKSLKFNPSFLVSICISMFRSPKKVSHQSRIQVYDNTIQSTLLLWKNQNPDISKTDLFNFLTELAVYLHLHTSSGLIDAFDIEHLCLSILQRNYQLNDRKILQSKALEFISLLNTNMGIVSQHDLQVFGFFHSEYQEYFVSQSLIRESSIEKTVERILSNAINKRFRESLLFALGWISWKWSFDDYNQFCHLLIIPRKDCAIPLGALLFFDAIDDLQRLPSNSIIYLALNSLFNHTSNYFGGLYFLSNLSKLPNDIIIEWIQLYLKDEKSISKFCQYLLKTVSKSDNCYSTDIRDDKKSIPLVVYQQLYSLLYTINPAVYFIIDQTLRNLVSLNKFSINEINENVFFSENIIISNAHPLILSAIIAVCGGINFENINNVHKINFSAKKMHRQSSILHPILDYFTNQNEDHTIKLQRLIKHFENILSITTSSDVSVDTIDTFIALLCLQGMNQPNIYQKYTEYQAFSIAIQRLKQIWFYLKETFEHLFPSHNEIKKSILRSEIEIILNEFFSQSNQTDEQYILFTLSCAAASLKLNMNSTSHWLDFEIFRSKNIDQYLECQSEFAHRIINRKIEQMKSNRHPFQMFEHQSFFLLIFLPQSLQPLYYNLFFTSNENAHSLPIIVLLSHCLILLDQVSTWNANFYLAVLMLLPMLKEHNLESYASILFQSGNTTKFRFRNEDQIEFFKVFQDQIFIDQPGNLINIERQRISKIQGTQADLQLFAASICLARLYQEQYGSSNDSANLPICLPKNESDDIHFAIMNIIDPFLRIFALDIILNGQYIAIFDQEQTDRLTFDIINQLKILLPSNNLLISTLLFVRSYRSFQNHPDLSQEIVETIGKKLNDKQTEEQKVAFIALKHLNDPMLSSYLSEFVQQTDNLSDLFQFNSIIFHQYFTKMTLFKSSNSLILSSMYLTELAFDAQILTVYKNAPINEYSPKEEFNRLWNESSSVSSKMMTLKIAEWITNYLQTPNKTDFYFITKQICGCWQIHTKALKVVEKWLDYRMNKHLKIYAYYATLILTKEGFPIQNFNEIIQEIFISDQKFDLKRLIENILHMSSVNSVFIRQILINLQKNLRYFSQISIHSMDQKDIFEIFLTLELERIISNRNQTSEKQTKSYLLLIHGCSQNLEIYLQEYILRYLNVEKNNIQIDIIEEYIAVIIKWTIEMSINPYYLPKFSNKFIEWILTFLYNESYPRIQKTIFNALNSVFNIVHLERENIFLHNDIFIHIEKFLYSWNIYSEDVLAACLLAYGNYILKMNKLGKKRNIPDEIQNILMNLYQTSSTELVSIRAAFVLIFMDHSDLTFNQLSNWFENKQGLTLKQRYLILLQITLYKTLVRMHFYDIEILNEFLDKFIIELSNYVYKKENLDYLADVTPNYIEFGLEFCKRNMTKLRNAFVNNHLNEYDFQQKLSLYFYETNNGNDQIILIQFYVALYMITDQLIEMLQWINTIEKTDGWKYIEHIQTIADRDIIESLFQSLHLTASQTKSRSFLAIFTLLVRFAQNQIVSLIEIHEHIARAIENWSYDNGDDDQRWREEEIIFDLLLDITCIKKLPSTHYTNKYLTENSIDRHFQEQVATLEKKLFLRRNFFLKNFKSISRFSN